MQIPEHYSNNASTSRRKFGFIRGAYSEADMLRSFWIVGRSVRSTISTGCGAVGSFAVSDRSAMSTTRVEPYSSPLSLCTRLGFNA